MAEKQNPWKTEAARHTTQSNYSIPVLLAGRVAAAASAEAGRERRRIHLRREYGKYGV